jgi:hypothetical protein
MKKTFILLQASIIVLMLTFISFKASAQFFSGPSDNTTAPPTLANVAAKAGKVICSGGTISLTATGTLGNTYTWYKTPLNGGTAVEVQAAGAVNVTGYTETATTAGYYTYYVEQTNSTGCSTMSNPITVFVLPSLSPLITGPAAVCENNQTTANLKVTPSSLLPGYTYTYQWTKNGVNILGANLDNYTVSELTVAPSISFAVKVGIDLNTTCTPNTSNALSVAVIALPTPPSITIN